MEVLSSRELNISQLNLRPGERVIVKKFMQLMAFPVAESSASKCTLNAQCGTVLKCI